MKKVLKRLSKTLLILMLLIITDITLVLNCVQAANQTKERVYEIDYCEGVLVYKGISRYAIYVVYEKDGVQYPAYCVDPKKKGVGDTDAYEVNVEGYITDVMLWRILINGYPYKTIGELGVANAKEAYLATKQAVYCYLDNRNVEEYSGVGEAGARTLNALKQIWYNAQNSTETKISNTVDIVPVDTEWKQDNINPNYISKTYQVRAVAPMVNYEIKIEGKNLPEGLMIVDKNNNVTQLFSPSEEFKILIPINELESDGTFEIKLETKMDTKPVLYGVSQNSNLQSYALTAFTYEDASGTYAEQYTKNNAQIKILKQEKGTKRPLEGVEFQLLNSEKNAIYQSLITNKNGEILLENVIPGTYYLRETKTLAGYVRYDEDIKIEINLNEQINVIVNNTKEKNIEVSKEVTNIEVEKNEENLEQKKNETNINKETNIININKESEKTNINEKNNITNINEKISNKNTNIENSTTNIKKLPKTGM